MATESAVESPHASRRACKICGHDAPFWDACDFSTHCMRSNLQIPPSGISVPYYRCSQCGFAFTTYMDDFRDEDFKSRIYNEDYIKFDPGFDGKRAEDNGKTVLASLGLEAITVFDYGGGRGDFSRYVNTAGMRLRAVSWDPFFDRLNRPTGTFDLVYSCEVFEHSPDPRATLEDMLSFCDGNKLLLLSTLCQPPEIEELKTGWWYCSPRNAHISLHTRASLQWLADEFGLGLMHLEDGVTSDGVHLFYDRIPGWLGPQIGVD